MIRKLQFFLLDFGVYILFLLSMTFKLYLFSKLTNTTFLPDSLQYFKVGFQTLFNEGSFESFYRGLFMVSVGALLLVSFWLLLLPLRKKVLSIVIVDFLLSFLLISDLIYYRYFHDLLSVSVFSQVNQAGAIKGSIIDLFQKNDVIFFVDLLVFVAILVFLYVKKFKGMWKPIFLPKVITAVLVLVVGFLFVKAPINAYTEKYGDVLFRQNWYNMSVFSQTGLIGFHGYDVYKYLDENVIHKKVITQKEKDEAKDWFTEHQEALGEKTPYYGVAKGKNVIIVQLEAFNNFFINREVNGQVITPNINKIIEESMYYENFYHQAAQGRTSDAEFLVNASLYPLSSGSVYVKYSDHKYDSLPSILESNGYVTNTFHAYEKSFWNRYAMYQNYGIDHFFGKEDFKPGEIAGWALGDRPFFQQSIDHLTTLDKPFYGFMVSLSSHHPYDIQAKYKELDLTGYDGIFANYLHSVHYVDQALGEMVERLKKEGLWDESVFIFYGDHDYGVQENDSMLKIAGLEQTDLNAMKKYNQVPLVIHLPNGQGKGIYQKSAGQLDIEPTILHLLGIDMSNKYIMGSNILTEENNLVAFRYGDFTDGKVFYDASQDWVFENGICYDLATNAETNVEKCRQGHDATQKRLSVSDDVLVGDLIREFEAKK